MPDDILVFPVATKTTIHVAETIDRSKLSAFQIGVFFLCAVCLLMDGFDIQAMGFTAPSVIQDWSIAPSTIGPVLSAALVGILVGSLFFSMFADRIGRRPVLILAALVFSGFTLITARVSSINELLALRFLAGVGLGGIVPNVTALVSEYSPARLRATLIMNVGNGLNAGAAFGGFIAAWLIPNFGWRSVFTFGGVVSLLVAVLMISLLPESPQFLAVRGKKPERIGRWLKRIDSEIPSGPGVEYKVPEDKHEGVPILQLFKERRALGTILLWITNFMNLLNLYFLSSWLPTLVTGLGYSTRQAVLIGTSLQLGAILGSITLGWFVHRFGFVPTLATCFALGCVNVAIIGYPGLSLGLLGLIVFLAGIGIPGAQGGINALASSYYPTDLRATGVGAGLGVGRVGAIIGPLIGGEFLRLHWTNQQLFFAAAVPAFVSLIVMISLRWVLKPAQSQPASLV
jgi:AAHS family 4-hydroxybenzoate transporter-like MFS transporter